MSLFGLERQFLGQGWHFPLESDGRGGMALAKYENDIEEAIKIILGTAKGERVMRPEFGSSIHEFVFAPNNATTIRSKPVTSGAAGTAPYAQADAGA